MVLTDWVFPEMGYMREQDKRALYEKKIAPVYSGVTDNRSRVAEGNFCHTLVLPVKISGKRKGDKQMKPYLKAEEIRIAAELLMERKKKDPCYKCAYNRNSPCIGFCYQQMTAHPVDPNERL